MKHYSEQIPPGEGLSIAVGMSGGVDSAVTALLLKKKGWKPFALFMKNWEEKDASGRCQSESDWEDVLRICDRLDISCHAVNFVEEYWNNVFVHFLEELKAGHTPNPDILCNREIKFNLLLKKAEAFGAEFLATGHYCQKNRAASSWDLIKGIDPNKDQSYFLCAITQKALAQALFPIGALVKKEVRALASDARLPVAEKKDSTGICFIGKRDFKNFVSGYLPYNPGNIETSDGKIIGKHDGIAYYTIGQRQGLAIGGAGDAWFVAHKDIMRNVLIVVQGASHPALFKKNIFATEISWINQTPTFPLQCQAKVRYRQQEQPCTVEMIGDRASIIFDQPQRAITARQAVVFYQNEICLGGGLIAL